MLSQYFSAIAREARLDSKEWPSILELTKEIAIRAGYTRQEVTQKNGKKVIKTIYTNTIKKYNDKGEETNPVQFDSILSAKWFMYFKNMFISKLIKQPKLQDYYDYILTETFHAVFSSLNLDKLKYDAGVVKLVKTAFWSRTGIALWEVGSDTKTKQAELARKLKGNEITLEEAKEQGYDETKANKWHDNCRLNVNARAHSLEALNETINYQPEDSYRDDRLDDLVLTIKCKLGDNDLANRLLECMLSAKQMRVVDETKQRKDGSYDKETPKDRGYIDPSDIVNYMEFTSEELKPANRAKNELILTNAYRIIRYELLKNLKAQGIDISKYKDMITEPTFDLSRKDRVASLIERIKKRNEAKEIDGSIIIESDDCELEMAR